MHWTFISPSLQEKLFDYYKVPGYQFKLLLKQAIKEAQDGATW